MHYAMDNLREHERRIDSDLDLSNTTLLPMVHSENMVAVKWNELSNDHQIFLQHSILARSFTFTNSWHLGAAEDYSGPAMSSITPPDSLESTFLFYRRISRLAPAHRKWNIVHSYTRNYQPLSHSRTKNFISPVAPLIEVGDDAMPITCLSMNHVGWIEAREQFGEQNEGRFVFVFVSLPDPLEASLPMTTRELDIPSDVLRRATHAWMNSAMGTITIVTHNNRLNVYTY